MLILAFDTCLDKTYVVLRTEDDIISSDTIYSDDKNYHSAYLISTIRNILRDSKKTPKDVDAIAINVGPGSFTGIRIGLSIAKTIAYALNLKIHTISSLKAYLISSDINEDKMAVIEDNKGYYICAFDKDNNTIVEETYLEENPYTYKEVDYKLDINKIIDYCNKFESENPHHIKANYIKKIEVEK